MAMETRQELRSRQREISLIGGSQVSMRMRKFAEMAAASDHTVLLTGETGTGKDHLAEFIHQQGRRTEGRAFVPVDCGTLSETLSETELFGHMSGAFTDARTSKLGLVQVASGGTLFFNEVANMSMTLQAKFLRVVEKRSFRSVGGTKEYPVDARIIVATNANLKERVRRGEFREDLYHRLNGIGFAVPALRDRSDDIPDLLAYFLQGEECPGKRISPEALRAMKNYEWPGNVRELRNVLIRAVFLSGAEPIEAEHVEPYMVGVEGTHDSEDLPTWKECERRYFRSVLVKAEGSRKMAAEIAGVTPRTLDYTLRKLNLQGFVKHRRRRTQDVQ